MLQTVPGVIVDRVNVGGAESGQQSTFQAKGASVGDNTWNIDGISVTDMSALGSSSTYYDFDMFQEMNATTGGTDPTVATPGVSLNMVLRSGTNTWRGSGRYYFENHSLQSNNVPANDLGVIKGYNRIDELKDFGFRRRRAREEPPLYSGLRRRDAPAAQDLQSVQHDRRRVAAGVPLGHRYGLRTVLKRCDDPPRLLGEDDVRNEQRHASVLHLLRRQQGEVRPRRELVSSDGNDGQPDGSDAQFYKGEANLTLGNTTFVSARYAHLTGGFTLTPKGGVSSPVYLDSTGTWHGSYYYYATDRPQDTLQADGNIFKGKNELKFGFSWKKASVTSESGFAATGGLNNSNFTICQNAACTLLAAQLSRAHNANTSAAYTAGYFGDTISAGRMTFNAADHATIAGRPRSASSTDPANTAFDPLGQLPSISSAAASDNANRLDVFRSARRLRLCARQGS